MNTFSKSALKGLTKMGNYYCPQNGEFPAFEQSAGLYKLNDLVANVPEDDFSALSMVLAIISFLPDFMVKWLVGVLERSATNPSDGIVAASLRQLNLGVRGLCYSVYYSEFSNPAYKGKTPLQLMDYQLNRIEN